MGGKTSTDPLPEHDEGKDQGSASMGSTNEALMDPLPEHDEGKDQGSASTGSANGASNGLLKREVLS